MRRLLLRLHRSHSRLLLPTPLTAKSSLLPFCSPPQHQFPTPRCLSSASTSLTTPTTHDGLTVSSIAGKSWPILDEAEGDWRSHAAAIAQSIQLIKRRMQWKKITSKLEGLSFALEKPELWDDPVYAGRVSREHGGIVGKMKEVNMFEQQLLEHIDMLRLAREENDEELESDCMKALLNMRRNAKERELEALLSGDHDSCSCFIERATVKVDGEYAFGYAKAEIGVHRLVRISPFDSGKRRHTSFAAVAVTPILGDVSSQYQIKESDLRIERFRSGGAGGQHANTTDSAVRIVHVPTGVTATCQNERSQHRNKASAMAVLQSRLDQLEIARQARVSAEHNQSLTDVSWGNQIRTYVLHPYRMVKDLRTNYEVSDPDSVLDGDLDGFILSFLSASLDKEDEDN